MDNNTKKQIKIELEKYVSHFESQNKAVASLSNVSVATVSNILNDKNLEKVSDEMWRNIAKQIGYLTDEAWQIVETTNYKDLKQLYSDSAEYSLCFGITGNASVGKTETAKLYKADHRNVYLVRCDEFWNRKHFLSEMLRSMGIEGGGYTVPELMDTAVKHLLKANKPTIILDEIDKVNDNILCSIISIYNRIEGHCGLVLQATDHFYRRMDRGLKLKKKGYKELWSRMGSKLIQLEDNTDNDILNIILANGITDKAQMFSILNDSEHDLRRVKRLVQILKLRGGK